MAWLLEAVSKISSGTPSDNQQELDAGVGMRWSWSQHEGGKDFWSAGSGSPLETDHGRELPQQRNPRHGCHPSRLHPTSPSLGFTGTNRIQERSINR